MFRTLVRHTHTQSLFERYSSTFEKYSRDRREGQVIILTVTALGGIILGATTIAGLLTVYQIRQATDMENSAKAIYAADAGIEWAFYDFQCHLRGDPSVCRQMPPQDGLSAAVGDPYFDLDRDGGESPLDVSYRVKDFEGGIGDFDYVISRLTEKIISTGIAGHTGRASSRAFELQLR